MPHPPSAVGAALEALDANERDVLVVLCLCDDAWLSRTAWKEKVNNAGIVDDRGRQIPGEAFKGMLAKLTEKGASVAVANGYALAEAWLAPLLDDAHRRARLVPIADRLAEANTHFRYSWRRERLGVKADLRFALAAGSPDEVARAEQTFADHERYSGKNAITLVDVLGVDVPAAWIARLDERRRVEHLAEGCERAFIEVRALGAGLRETIASRASS